MIRDHEVLASGAHLAKASLEGEWGEGRRARAILVSSGNSPAVHALLGPQC